MQISKIYAQSAHESSRKMETIARKTEQETLSMHIITFVTLIFLPGTFIAVRSLRSPLVSKVGILTSNTQTFFQSGIIAWNDAGVKGASWLFREDAFALFAEISFGITAVTITIWLLVVRCLRRRSQERLEAQQNSDMSGANMV